MANASEVPTILADGANLLAVHNGNPRVQFMRMGLDGKPQPAVELQLPVGVVKSIIDALRKVGSG
jgi:hypothetical protein